MSSSSSLDSEIIHASAVAIEGRGVVLLGPSGSGKSTLAARLMEGCGGILIGDDRLVLSSRGAKIMASPHENLKGLLELRGLGLVRCPYIETATIDLAVDLVAREAVARMAPADWYDYGGARVARLRLHAHDSATPMIIQTALQTLGAQGSQNSDFPNKGFPEDGIYESPSILKP